MNEADAQPHGQPAAAGQAREYKVRAVVDAVAVRLLRHVDDASGRLSSATARQAHWSDDPSAHGQLRHRLLSGCLAANSPPGGSHTAPSSSTPAAPHRVVWSGVARAQRWHGGTVSQYVSERICPAVAPAVPVGTMPVRCTAAVRPRRRSLAGTVLLVRPSLVARTRQPEWPSRAHLPYVHLPACSTHTRCRCSLLHCHPTQVLARMPRRRRPPFPVPRRACLPVPFLCLAHARRHGPLGRQLRMASASAASRARHRSALIRRQTMTSSVGGAPWSQRRVPPRPLPLGPREAAAQTP